MSQPVYRYFVAYCYTNAAGGMGFGNNVITLDRPIANRGMVRYVEQAIAPTILRDFGQTPQAVTLMSFQLWTGTDK